MKKISQAQNNDDIHVLLAEVGIEATAEQIELIIGDSHTLGETLVSEDGEIDMEALDQVAGGSPVGGVILGGIFLLGGIMTGVGWKFTLVAACPAFAIGCMAPCA